MTHFLNKGSSKRSTTNVSSEAEGQGAVGWQLKVLKGKDC